MENLKTVTTKSAGETFALAEQFAKSLKGGEVVCFEGDLGSGKTTFVTGLAKALGVKEAVQSPTFVKLNLWPTKHPSISRLCHIDAYRIEGEKELAEIGAFDCIRNKEMVTVIEWSERIKNGLEQCTAKIRFEYGEQENERVITFD